jgi:hypothetical protein
MREHATPKISVREMARLIGVSKTQLSAVELGHRPATPFLITAYRQAITAGSVEPVKRRSLAPLAAAVAASAAGATPARVGAPEIASVHSLALDLDLTHPFAVDVAEVALARARTMLGAQVRSALRPALHTAVGLLADRVGWGMLEVGRDPVGALTMAQQVAAGGDDPDLRAHALLDLAVATADPHRALEILDYALQLPISTAELVNLHAVAARRAAKVDPRRASEHLAQAQDTDPQRGSGEWSARITSSPGHLLAIIGFASFATAHPQAREQLTEALGRLSSRRGRTQGRCHARLAVLAIADRDPDTAEYHLTSALTGPRSRLVTSALAAVARAARDAGYDDLAYAAASSATQ